MGAKIKTEQGMVGFLDILGYLSFLENNEAEKAAVIIKNHILEARNVEREYNTILPTVDQDDIKAYLEHFSWLIFSDTILIMNSFQSRDSKEEKHIRWYLFLITLIILYQKLFDNGLPIRGGVSYGKFFVEEHCFAGKPIVEAYQLSRSLNLAAIAVDQTALDELKRMDVLQEKIFDEIVLKYLTPIKDQAFQEKYLLVPSLNALPPLNGSDIRQTVAECFWKHNKDLYPEAVEKMENTEMFFRFAKMKGPVNLAE